MKKRFAMMAAACAVAGCLGMFGCSSGGSEPEATDQPEEPQQASKAEEAPAEEAKYAVTIDDCTTTTDYSGKSAIVVTYTFENASDEAQSFMVAISAKCFQNGVQLAPAIVEDIDAQSTMNDVKPGASTTVQQAYLLDDQSDVTVECSELISFDNEILAEKTFSVA